MQAQQAMPELVATAVNTVMRGVRTLIKSERNADRDYRFASIDDFLSALNPLCAKAGLIIVQNEIDARLVHNGTDMRDRSWLWTTFEFHLAHSSGAMWGPVTRSVMVAADGAQAFGAAQSYALKQFMRALFQIPTNDAEDADHQPKDQPKPNGSRRPELVTNSVDSIATPFDAMRDRASTTPAAPAADQRLRAVTRGRITPAAAAPSVQGSPPAPMSSAPKQAAPDDAAPDDATPEARGPEETGPDKTALPVSTGAPHETVPAKSNGSRPGQPKRRRPKHELWPFKTPHPLTKRRPAKL